MIRKILVLFFSWLILFQINAYAGGLIPGFSKEESIEMLKINSRYSRRLPDSIVGPPAFYHQVYKSPEMGLQNQWSLWMSNDDSVAVICIRGTAGSITSWLANLYSVMVPAKGYLQLEKDYRFDYYLADDPKAAVHTGWLVSTGMLIRDIMPKIDSLVAGGIKNFLITGHSQGGGIAYLLTSHLYRLRQTGRIPGSVILKTYCSAAPKPGNLYYAYAYEASTAGGWAFNVVNTADWVPEMPVSVQTVDDFNDVNPFTDAVNAIKKQKFPTRFLMMRAYKRLSKGPRKSREDYLQLIGDRLYIMIQQTLPEFEKPTYFESINYVRTGNTIVLFADEKYKATFPDDLKQIFMHHYFQCYLFLINQFQELPISENN